MEAKQANARIVSTWLFLVLMVSPAWAATVSIPNTTVQTGTATIQVPIQVNPADGIETLTIAIELLYSL